MSYRFLPIPASEMLTYYHVLREAFVPGIVEVLYPSGFSGEAIEHLRQAIVRSQARHPDRHHIFKVVDTSLPDTDPHDKVVGTSQWLIFPHERSAAEMAQESEISDQETEQFGLPPGYDPDVRKDWGAALAAKKKKFVGGKACIVLALLATRPGYERRGIGSLHMAWGTQKADELGVPCYLESSPKGVALYKNWGFDVVDQVEWDARKYGYHEALTHTCMLRPPQKSKQSTSQS